MKEKPDYISSRWLVALILFAGSGYFAFLGIAATSHGAKVSSQKQFEYSATAPNAVPITAPGWQFGVVHHFVGLPDEPAASLTLGTDGNFYGTTKFGGTSFYADSTSSWPLTGSPGFGVVFVMTPAGRVTTLHNFSGGDGAFSLSALVQGADGNFYGTTSDGGTHGFGTVFMITPAGQFTTLYNFSGADGGAPIGALAFDDAGNLYGTTSQGGAGGYGTVFKLTSAGQLSTLYSFSGAPSDGAAPTGGLTAGSDGNFYGTTSAVGLPQFGLNGTAHGLGTVFMITPAGVLTTLYAFSGTDGAAPIAGLVQGDDGNFYGTTEFGGSLYVEASADVGGFGTVFKITPSGQFTLLHSFTGTTDGSYPWAGSLAQGADGNFYGTTFKGFGLGSGSDGAGTIFVITPSGQLTTLHGFSEADGTLPEAGLVQGSDGSWYGTTFSGGAVTAQGLNGGVDGTAFKFDAATNTYTVLHEFGGVDGAGPTSNLIQDSNGQLYGVTVQGGLVYAGNVFKLTPGGVIESLHDFFISDGWYPNGGLLLGGDGLLYGTTLNGGFETTDASEGTNGVIFNLSTSGSFTLQYEFTGTNDGSEPAAALIKGSDGSFYGTATGGDAIGAAAQNPEGYALYNCGVVFKTMSSGAPTIIYSFTGPDGCYPGPIVEGADGNFYGTTLVGGPAINKTTHNNGYGTIFKVTPAGQLTTLYSFSGPDGDRPVGIVQRSDGNFYGATSAGGPAFNGTTVGYGTIFKLTPTGQLTTLYNFSGPDGATPLAGVIQASDGNFYGTTSAGGQSNDGTVFKVTPTGELTTLHAFTGSDGALPEGSLLEDNAGNFYGTAMRGGLDDLGVVFRLSISPAVQLTGVVSRKAHGTAGTFDIDVTNGTGIECRSGGTNGDYTMVFTFANPLTSVSGATAASSSGSVVNNNIDSNDAHNYIVNLTGITNAQTITVSLSNVTDSVGNFSPAVAGSMKVLIGDTNGDGFVNSADIGQTKSQSGQPVNGSNFREDVNADGFMNSADIGLVKSKSGTALP